jgi:DNA primase
MTCRVVMLPDGEDVDSLLQARGAEAFQPCWTKPRGAGFLPARDRRHVHARVGAMGDGFLRQLDEPQWRSPLITRIAQRLGFKEEELRARLATQGRERARAPVAPAAPTRRPGDRGHKLDRQLVRFAVCNPHYVAQLRDKGMGRVLVSEFALCLWEKMEANPGLDVMHILTPAEKRYWVECLETNTRTPEDAQREWTEICDFL